MIFSYLGRLRRSRGFGVHSPFAFRMVTEVLRQNYHYYATERLAAIATPLCQAPMLGIIHRLVCELLPRAVWIDPALPAEAVAEAVRLANSSTLITTASAEADMIIARRDIPADALRSERAEVVLTEATGSPRLDALESGCFTFSNGRSLVGVKRPDLPRQHFEVLF